MFDKVFVLSKGGHCIYSGRPQHLRQYLDECDAPIFEHQFPIEAILKYACFDPKEPKLSKMIEKTSTDERHAINDRFVEETHLAIDGIRLFPKRFFFYDLIVLLRRRLNKLVRDEWRMLIFRIALYQFFAVALLWIFSQDITGPSGCISLDDDYNNTCTKTVAKLREEDLLYYNLNYNFYAMLVILLFSFFLPSLTFPADLTLFINEHRNGKIDLQTVPEESIRLCRWCSLYASLINCYTLCFTLQ